MVAPLLSNDERKKFAEMARRLIDQKLSPPMVRSKLGDAFGLNGKQVQNALYREQIKLNTWQVRRRRLKDLSEDEQEELVAMAKELHRQGIGNDEIRARVAARFNVYERSVTTRCRQNGLDIRTSISLTSAGCYADPVKIEPKQHNVNTGRHPYYIAARILDRKPGVTAEVRDGVCYRNGFPWPAMKFLAEAGVELPQ